MTSGELRGRGAGGNVDADGKLTRVTRQREHRPVCGVIRHDCGAGNRIDPEPAEPVTDGAVRGDLRSGRGVQSLVMSGMVVARRGRAVRIVVADVPRRTRPHEREEDEDACHDPRTERRNHHLQSNTPGPAGPFHRP
jgi:hypothetical protein